MHNFRLSPFQFQKIETLWQKNFSPDFSSSPSKISDKIDDFFVENSSIHFSRGTKTKKFSFENSQNPVFWNENNLPFLGLKNLQAQKIHEKFVYLIDNHQYALWGFFDFWKAQNEQKICVVHIDAHRDDAVFPFSVQNIQENFLDLDTIISACRVCDYLDAGKKMGMIDEIFSLTQSFEFENFVVPKKPFVLNLDLDIFGAEGVMVETEKKVEVIAKAWEKAEMIICATSPGFLHAEDAQKIFEILTHSSPELSTHKIGQISLAKYT